ncbi:MAG TPA: HAD family hydrolase [bacterium]|nr:HAD family hydrolase [bacterium]
MTAIRAVLFDLDGTLLDSLGSHHSVYRKVFADLGISLQDEDYARHYSPNWYIFYERMGVPQSRWADADRIWLRHYAEEAPHPREGADALLAAVKNSGRSLGLVTSGERSRVERDIHRAGWAQVFGVVVCGGDVEQRKPLPGPLLHALAALGTAPHSALYVGDTVEDVEMGKAAQTVTAAVLGGFSRREVLEAASPDYLVGSLSELTNLLD